MNCNVCGEYANASVVGVHGGRTPVCDEHIGAEPDAVYRLGAYPHVNPAPKGKVRPPVTDKPSVVRLRKVGEPAVTEGRASVINAPAVPEPFVSETSPEKLIPNRIVASFDAIGRGVVLTLPEPPAANRYLRRHGNITYKTREAKAYCELVATLAAPFRVNGGPAFPTGDVTVVVVWRRSRKAGDLGERTKVLYDALQGTLYTDDKQIAQDWRRRVDEHPTLQPGTVRVEVSAV